VTLCSKIYCGVTESNAPQHLKSVSFVKGVPDLENPESISTLIGLDDLMDPAYYIKRTNYLPKDSIFVTLVWY